MKTRRVYVYEELYLEVMDFAYDRWKKHQDRAPNGKPLPDSFPASLKMYIEELTKSDGLAMDNRMG